MMKRRGKIEKAINECVRNATRFLSDAKLLIKKNRSYGHAFGLCVLADEEIGKAVLLTAVSKGFLKFEDVKNQMFKHQFKLKMQVLMEYAEKTIDSDLLEVLMRHEDIRYTDFRIKLVKNHLKKYGKAIRKKRKQLDRMKQLGFYVEIDKKGFSSPESFSMNDAENFLNEVQSRLEISKEFHKGKIEIPSELVEIWKSEMG